MIDFGKAKADLDDLFALAERSERSMRTYVGSLCEMVIESLRDRLERDRRLKDNTRIWVHNIARLWEQDKEARLRRWRWIQNEKRTYKSDLYTYISNLKGAIPRVPVGELYIFLAMVRKGPSVPPGGAIPKVSGTFTPVENGTGPPAPE